MKAWVVRVKDDFCAEVVFAGTRGQARSLALCTDTCEYSNFLDIEVHRAKELDKYYKAGKWRMDWDNPQDRIALVKDGDFMCYSSLFMYFGESFYEKECTNCSARKYCDRYTDLTEGSKEE